MKIASRKHVVWILALAVVLGGCESKNNEEITGPVIPPGNSIASIATARNVIMAGDSTMVTAFVQDADGTPLEGAKVGFTADWGALGELEVTSGADGRVVTVLLTPITSQNRTVQVRASTAGRAKFTTVDITPFVDDGGSEDVAEIEVSMSPNLLPADGLSAASIHVTATNSGGDPVPGAVVRLAAGERFQDVNGDGVFTAGVDLLLVDVNANDTWDAAGTTAGYVTTGVDGTATTNFQSGSIPGEFALRATAGSVSTEATFTLEGLPEIVSIALESEEGEIQVEGTGGAESAELQATGLDQDGEPVPAGLPVTFAILQGPHGGESLEDEGYGPVIVLTDAEGVARVRLRSGTASGTVVVEATAKNGAVVSQATRVAIAAGPPHYIDAGADPVNIRGWDLIGVNSKITAIVSDVYENPVRDGTVVYFTTEEGTVTPSSPTEGGFAEATFFSGAPRNDGVVHITASTSGGTLSTQTGLITSGPPASVTILSSPSSLNADGRSRGRIVVRVLDSNGNFVVAGTLVEFETTLGSIDASNGTTDGWYDSIAEARIYSNTLDMDYVVQTPDNGLGGVADISVRAGLGGGASAATQVDFLTTSASAGKSSTTLPISADIGESVPFDLTVRDYWGNPLGGHVWSFIVLGGGTITASGTSNRFGVVSGLSFTAPVIPGKVTVQALDTDPAFGDAIVLSRTIDIQ